MSQLPALALQAPGGPELLVVLFVLLIMAATFAIWVGVSYWVYKDAQKRNMDNPALWAVVTFAVGIVGVVVYLLVREDV